MYGFLPQNKRLSSDQLRTKYGHRNQTKPNKPDTMNVLNKGSSIEQWLASLKFQAHTLYAQNGHTVPKWIAPPVHYSNNKYGRRKKNMVLYTTGRNPREIRHLMHKYRATQ